MKTFDKSHADFKANIAEGLDMILDFVANMPLGGTIGIGTLEKHNVGWVLMHSNGITEIKEDGKFGYLCKDEYDRCEVSYHRKPNRKIEIRGLVNVLKEQTIS